MQITNSKGSSRGSSQDETIVLAPQPHYWLSIAICANKFFSTSQHGFPTKSAYCNKKFEWRHFVLHSWRGQRTNKRHHAGPWHFIAISHLEIWKSHAFLPGLGVQPVADDRGHPGRWQLQILFFFEQNDWSNAKSSVRLVHGVPTFFEEWALCRRNSIFRAPRKNFTSTRVEQSVCNQHSDKVQQHKFGFQKIENGNRKRPGSFLVSAKKCQQIPLGLRVAVQLAAGVCLCLCDNCTLDWI